MSFWNEIIATFTVVVRKLKVWDTSKCWKNDAGSHAVKLQAQTTSRSGSTSSARIIVCAWKMPTLAKLLCEYKRVLKQSIFLRPYSCGRYPDEASLAYSVICSCAVAEIMITWTNHSQFAWAVLLAFIVHSSSFVQNRPIWIQVNTSEYWSKAYSCALTPAVVTLMRLA